MTGAYIRSLGHDILVCSEPDLEADRLAGRHRFLDELWLPCSLADLTEEQIFVINRYRESVFSKEKHYEFASHAHRAFEAAVSALKAKNVVEIGCGKFPVNTVGAQYLGVDIDAEAVATVRQLGLSACRPSELATVLKTSADLVISAYAMHFSIDDAILAELARSTEINAVFCFNLIVDDSVSAFGLLGRLAVYWPYLQVAKTPEMARREFFFIAGRDEATHRMTVVADAIRSSFNN